MTLIQIVAGLAVIIGVAVIWANATKGVDPSPRFTDVDKDGAPDATPHQKGAAIEAFKLEQSRRHPEDHSRADDPAP